MSAPVPAEVLRGIDPALLERQRWFRAKGRVTGPIEVADAWEVAREPHGWWLLLHVPTADGPAIYQVPVVLHREGSPVPYRIIGGYMRGNVQWLILDGAGDGAMLADLVSRANPGGAIDTAAGGKVGGETFGPPIDSPREIAPLATDSSNTLFALDGRLVIKIYRALDAAGMREATLLSALERTRGEGETGVPAVRAFVDYHRPGAIEGRAALAIVQDLVPDATDAWSWLVDRLTRGPVDIADDIDRMARAVAGIHRGLLPIGSRRWTAEDTAALAGRIRRQIAALSGNPMNGNRDLLADLARAGECVGGAIIGDGGLVMAVHGDLHLGQILRGDERYYVIDFEGEPLAPPDERMAWHSPLKDVAGMLRSFHYATAVARRDGAPGDDAAWDAWLDRCEARFLATYAPIVPPNLAPGNDRMALLALHLIEKATYEIAYELRARPDWVGIPRHGLRRVLARIG